MKLQQYSLGSYLNDSISFFPKAIASVWKLALPLFGAAALVMGVGFSRFSTLFSSIEAIENGNFTDIIAKLFLPYSLIILGSVLAGIGSLLLQAIISDRAFCAIEGRSYAGAAAARLVVRKAFWPLFWQQVLVGLVSMAVIAVVTMIAAFIIVPIVSLSTAEADLSTGGIITIAMLPLLLMLPAVAFIYWFQVRSLIAPQAIVQEKIGAWSGIGRSFALTKGKFWRIFGIWFLTGLIVNFAISIISGPIVFISVLPGYLDYIKIMIAEPDTADQLSRLAGLFRNLSWTVAISSLLQYLVSYTYYPVLGSLIYTDLAVRKAAPGFHPFTMKMLPAADVEAADTVTPSIETAAATAAEPTAPEQSADAEIAPITNPAKTDGSNE
ncbi:MAG: hypothetical protein KKI09_03825 [Spirochaetes bacterium]|nr:hypothetical protein [Spirochaetota bacterium]MBU0954536.1 hypothetical protein [Spirochaetota bacterium]